MKRDRSLFDRIVHFIVFRGKEIEIFFFLTAIICAICFPFVKVNYDLSKYLPQFAQTKQALDVMEDEFGYPGMARIMVEDVSFRKQKE
uniref:hypothetical protein n=1 Tax=Clostridium sp. NkU-1 TaxID=1095009 RepID=UPI000AC93CAC